MERAGHRWSSGIPETKDLITSPPLISVTLHLGVIFSDASSPRRIRGPRPLTSLLPSLTLKGTDDSFFLVESLKILG